MTLNEPLAERPHNQTTEPGCRCHGCGEQYRVDINVPDTVWRQIGMPDNSGLLCGRCIASRLEHLGEFDAWSLVRIN